MDKKGENLNQTCLRWGGDIRLDARSCVCQHLVEKRGKTRLIEYVHFFSGENVFDPKFEPHGRNSRVGQVYVSRMMINANSAMVKSITVSLTRSVCRFSYWIPT